MPCSMTQRGLTRVGLEPPTSGSGWPVTIGRRFSLLQTIGDINFGLVRMFMTALLETIYSRSGSTLYRQNVGIPMGTNFAPLVADLFLFC